MVFILIFVLILSSNAWSQGDFDEQRSTLSKLADESCIGIVPLGVCPKAKHVVGALVLLREPSLIIQTIKKSGASSGGLNDGNLQFNEVRVLNNPLARSFHQAICSDLPDTSPEIYYISEPDALGWKEGSFERNLPQSRVASQIASQCFRLPLGAQDQCMKTWGTLYPRTGFIVSSSEPMASAVSAVRAVSIAKDPAPAHIVESRLQYSFNIKEDKLQMIQPVTSVSCISIGQNPSSWEKGKTSKDGQYVWFYWNWRLCCI